MNIPLTPLDGRYYDRIKELVPYVSEHALIKYRIAVEAAWLHKITTLAGNKIPAQLETKLLKLVENFSAVDAEAIRTIEIEVNHDVKAVEIWLGQFLNDNDASELVPYVHFGRTSEDINNLAYAMMFRDARDLVMVPAMREITEKLRVLAKKEASSVMVSRTHGQPATPTTLGKELAVFEKRLSEQIEHVLNVDILGKCNGATGTYAADSIAFPDVNWPKEMKEFVESLRLSFNPLTTQIEPHDWIARLNNEQALANTICIDLARDCWQYISIGYMKQVVVAGEVGSSTMPHKVNPIDFENAEANFGIANAILNHLASKLPISRLQRDLSDSSAMRATSEAYGHMLLALKSLSNGLSKVDGDADAMKKELDNEWALLTEAIQTVMRKNGIQDSYDQMKSLSRGKDITKKDVQQFISELKIDEKDKKILQELTPARYTGYAERLTNTT